MSPGHSRRTRQRRPARVTDHPQTSADAAVLRTGHKGAVAVQSPERGRAAVRWDHNGGVDADLLAGHRAHATVKTGVKIGGERGRDANPSGSAGLLEKPSCRCSHPGQWARFRGAYGHAMAASGQACGQAERGGRAVPTAEGVVAAWDPRF